MSYEILQSTKVFRVYDNKGNSIFIYGRVSESNNDSPKRYDTISFDIAGKQGVDLAMYLIHEVQSIVTGSLQLKNPDGNPVDTFIRRFLRNINKAKSIPVETITYTENGKGVYIVFGDEGTAILKFLEPKFNFYHDTLNGKFALRLNEFKEEENDVFTFLTSKDRTIEQAVRIVEDFPYHAHLFNGNHPTFEQFKHLYKNTPRWTFAQFKSKVDPVLKAKYLNGMTEEERADCKNEW